MGGYGMRIHVVLLFFFISGKNFARYNLLVQKEICCDRIIIVTEKPSGAFVIPHAPYEVAGNGRFQVFVPFVSVTRRLEHALLTLNKNAPYQVRAYAVKKPLKGIILEILADPSKYACLLKYDYDQNYTHTVIEIQNKAALKLVLEHCVDYRYA